MTVQKRLPVAAQVFQVWWYALNEEKLSPDADLGVVRIAFPDIKQQPRAECLSWKFLNWMNHL